MVINVVISIAQLALFVIGAPVLVGIMSKVRARAEGRKGAPVRQVLFDLKKLASKERIHAEHSSMVFAIAPLVLVSTTAVAIAISPILTTTPVLARSADLFVIVFLLLCGSLALALGGLDPGTAFGGMGASRAMTIGALAEPALLVSIFALSIQTGTSNLPGIVSATVFHPLWATSPERLLALVSIIIVVLAETGRIPFDNPSTHLELTMIHEAMTLEYAGPELALVTLAETMRVGLLFALIVNLFVPWGIATSHGIADVARSAALLGAKIVFIATMVALFEIRTAKIRLFRVPELLNGGFVLGVLAILTGLITR